MHESLISERPPAEPRTRTRRRFASTHGPAPGRGSRFPRAAVDDRVADEQLGTRTLGYGSHGAGNASYKVIFDPKDLAFSATFRSPDSPLPPVTGTVPEPTSLALAGIGLAGLGLSRRRGRRRG